MAFRLPRWGRKYLAGHYHIGPLQLYVNRGLGCVTVPLRIGCPPEVTELTLRSAEVEGN
jgi:predicted MPP superfamily phosphohydrolase